MSASVVSLKRHRIYIQDMITAHKRKFIFCRNMQACNSTQFQSTAFYFVVGRRLKQYAYTGPWSTQITSCRCKIARFYLNAVIMSLVTSYCTGENTQISKFNLFWATNYLQKKYIRFYKSRLLH